MISFTNPPCSKTSTFTHIGRHMLGLLTLGKHLEKSDSPRIYLFGTGPLEPSLAASVFSSLPISTPKLYAIEREKRLVDLAEQILLREGIAPDKLAEMCTNYDSQGERYANKHFAIPEVLRSNIEDTNSLLSRKIYNFENHLFYVDESSAARVVLEQADMFSYDIPEQPDAVFIGTVLTNARRDEDDGKILNWLSNLEKQLRITNGVMVVTLTPQDLYLRHSESNRSVRPTTLELIRGSEFIVGPIICESFVVISNPTARYVRGDYLAVLYPNLPNVSSKINHSPLCTPTAQAIIGKNTTHERPVTSIDLIWPPINEEFQAAWLNIGISRWDCYFDELPFQSKERVSRWNRFEQGLISYILNS